MEHPKAVCDSAHNELCEEGCHHHHPPLAALVLLHASPALGCNHNHLESETASNVSMNNGCITCCNHKTLKQPAMST